MKEYFSFSLFKDAMKQLRVHGFVFLIVVCFPVFFGGMFIDTNNANIPVSYLAVICYPIIAPIMTFYLFGFLNKRNSSDFYHAIPKSRTCVYITYISAIMTWITTILTVSTALAFICCQIYKHTTTIQEISDSYKMIEYAIEFEIAYKEMFLLLLSLLICSLLVISAITIGMSLSGTTFTAFTITGMILFLPSLLLVFINALIEEIAPFVSTEHFFFLIDSEIDNMVAGSVASIFGIFGYWNFEDIFLNGSKMIYTFLITVVYLVVGGLLFHKRKSECAGFSSVYQKVQTTIRCLCCITFSLIPLSLLFEKMTSDYYTNYTDIVMLYLIAIIIYFMFELISTKRVKNLIKAIPGLLIVVASNIVLCLIIFGTASVASKFQPDAEEIDYVVINFESYDREYFYQNEYLTTLASKCKIEDLEIRNLVSDSLKNTITYNFASDSDKWNFNYYNSCSVGICINGKMTYRDLLQTESNYIRLTNLVKSNTNIFQTYFDIPKPSKKDLNILNLDKSVLSDDKRMEIYDCFMKEVNTLPKTTKEMILLGQFYEPAIKVLPEAQQNMERFYLKQTFEYKKEEYYYRYAITPLTPKSYNMILQALSEHFTEFIEKPYALSNEDCYLLNILSPVRNTRRDISCSELYFDEFFDIAKRTSGIPTVEDEFYFVRNERSSDYIGVLKATDELDAFIMYLETENNTNYDYNYYYD